MSLARIDVRPSFMDTVSASGQEMIDNFNQVAKRVNALLNEENQKQLMATLRNLDTATSKCNGAREFDPAHAQRVSRCCRGDWGSA